jgi:hypothetical protein
MLLLISKYISARMKIVIYTDCIKDNKNRIVVIFEECIVPKAHHVPFLNFYLRIVMYRIKMKAAKKSDMGLEPGCCLNGRLPKEDINVKPSKDNLVKRIQGTVIELLD